MLGIIRCKRWMEVAVSLLYMAAVPCACATEITATQAKAAVNCWLKDDAALGCRFGGDVEDVRTYSTSNNVQFHVARLAGGGFVVTSADTALAPVVAFSSGGDFTEGEANPLWVLLTGDFAACTNIPAQTPARRTKAGPLSAAGVAADSNEAKWARLLGGGVRLLSSAGDGFSAISDLRVAPLVQSRWGQETADGGVCFNYYTPNNYPCGCVATAGAQIMRYFMWPSAATTLPQYTNPYCTVDGTTVALTTQGGSYDWGKMPLTPDSTITEEQRKAIGKLTSDIGICCGMAYESRGSGIGSYMLAETFTNHFGYGSALAAQWSGASDQSTSSNFRRAIISNLDAGYPLVMSLDGAAGGHAVVGDGYGYSDGALFVHLNFGWQGISDAWYSPPNLATGDDPDFNFSSVNGFVFNIIPQLPSSTVICSGRVLDADGKPVANASVSFARLNSTSSGGTSSATDTGCIVTDGKGIYALSLQPGQYLLTASCGGMFAQTTVRLVANVATRTEKPNMFYPNPAPTVNNLIGQDLILSPIAYVALPQFNPPSCLFYPTTNVTITCATSGATIRYTLDGTDPTESSAVYTGPITVSDDTTITAKAWASGMNPSVPISSTYTYDASQGAPKGDYFADPIIISGASGSRVVPDNSAYTVESGEPYHTLENGECFNQYNTIWYEWTAPGTGTMTFTAELRGGGYILPPMLAAYTGDSLSSIVRIVFDSDEDKDYVATITFSVTQGETYRIVGMSGYKEISGAFTLTWSGELTVAQTATPNTPEPVPYTWLQGYFPGYSTADYDAMALLDSDGDGYLNWEEYVLQTNPTDAASRLSVSIRMVDGVPHIDYEPKTFIDGYGARIKGANDLGAPADEWTAITAPTAAFRFFKVVVAPQ